MVRWYYAIAMSAGMHRTRQLRGDMGRQQWLLLPEQITMHHRYPRSRRKRAECGQMDPGATAAGGVPREQHLRAHAVNLRRHLYRNVAGSPEPRP